MAKCVLTFPTPTLTDEWVGCWVSDRRCWIGCWHWICAWLVELFLHQPPCCDQINCNRTSTSRLFLYFGKLFFLFFSFPWSLSSSRLPPNLSLHLADKGPSTGPHGEGRLAGPSDLQRDWDDQRGELVYLDCVLKQHVLVPLVEKPTSVQTERSEHKNRHSCSPEDEFW